MSDPKKKFSQGDLIKKARECINESLNLKGQEAVGKKREAYDYYERSVRLFDKKSRDYSKDPTAPKPKLLEINQNCNTLLSLSQMSVDIEVMSIQRTRAALDEEDQEGDPEYGKAVLEPKL